VRLVGFIEKKLPFPLWTKQAHVFSCPSERENLTTERRGKLDYE
jgi:hypothetical protein